MSRCARAGIQSLGGWFIWSFDGDDSSHTLFNAMKSNN
jgi:hypothetical protein